MKILHLLLSASCKFRGKSLFVYNFSPFSSSFQIAQCVSGLSSGFEERGCIFQLKSPNSAYKYTCGCKSYILSWVFSKIVGANAPSAPTLTTSLLTQRQLLSCLYQYNHSHFLEFGIFLSSFTYFQDEQVRRCSKIT